MILLEKAGVLLAHITAGRVYSRGQGGDGELIRFNNRGRDIIPPIDIYQNQEQEARRVKAGPTYATMEELTTEVPLVGMDEMGQFNGMEEKGK